MSARLWDLLAWIGLACVLCTPLVVAVLAMAGRREEEDEKPFVYGDNWWEVVKSMHPDIAKADPPIAGGFLYSDEEIRDFLRNADPLGELAARAKGGDE